MTDHDNLSRAHQLLASGQLEEARIYLEELLRQDPDNTDLLYNQGPLLCGPRPAQPVHLSAAPLPPDLAATLARLRGPGARPPAQGRLPQARKHAMQALTTNFRNPKALKNLGAIFGQEKGSLRALYYLRCSNEFDPKDLQTVYGLVFAA
jgi:tetratricopeptide (TPR) repeat protein